MIINNMVKKEQKASKGVQNGRFLGVDEIGLPCIKVGDEVIHFYNPTYNLKFTNTCVSELVLKIKEKEAQKKIKYDLVVGAESKGSLIAALVALQLNVEFVCFSKQTELYPDEWASTAIRSVSNKAQLYVAKELLLKYRDCEHVLFVDDVISTGQTADSIEEVLSYYNIKFEDKACCFCETKVGKKIPKDVICLHNIKVEKYQEEQEKEEF